MLTEAAKHSENFSARGEEGLLTILPAYQVTRVTEKAVSAVLQLLRLYRAWATAKRETRPSVTVEGRFQFP